MKPSAWTCLPQNSCNISSVWLGEGLQTAPCPDVAIKVSDMMEDGLPEEASFQFVVPLEDHSPRREIQHTFDKPEPLGVNDIGVLDAHGVLRYNAAAPQI